MQAPISLSIWVSSLRWTLRVHMKPPPSDQLWFGFTSMPDIGFNLASSVGEHKITNSHVAMFLINRFKTAIREAVVLPKCESLSIPRMIAEKDDWVQRKAAPFMWLNQENDHNSCQAAERRSKSEKPQTFSFCAQSEKMQKTANATQKPITDAGALFSSSAAQYEQVQKAANTTQKPIIEAEAISMPLTNSTTVIVESDRSLEEVKTPLLKPISSDKNSKDSPREISVVQSPSRSIVSGEDDGTMGKKLGRRTRMLDLGKKWGRSWKIRDGTWSKRVDILLKR